MKYAKHSDRKTLERVNLKKNKITKAERIILFLGLIALIVSCIYMEFTGKWGWFVGILILDFFLIMGTDENSGNDGGEHSAYP